MYAPLSLKGSIHPIFEDWVIPNEDGEADALWRELQQPLLLASRILETVGLPWLSEFCIDDIFRPGYPGPNPPKDHSNKQPSGRSDYERRTTLTTPEVIVRHHRAAWATPRLIKIWLASTDQEIRTNLPGYVKWNLNSTMFSTFGWVGYTCRHRSKAGDGPTADTPLQDRPEAVMKADEEARKKGASSRFMTVLIMKEFISRLSELRTLGLFGGEEYLFTAFMAAVTMLHE